MHNKQTIHSSPTLVDKDRMLQIHIDYTDEEKLFTVWKNSSSDEQQQTTIICAQGQSRDEAAVEFNRQLKEAEKEGFQLRGDEHIDQQTIAYILKPDPKSKANKVNKDVNPEVDSILYG